MSSTNATSDMFLKSLSSATKSNATVASTSPASKSSKLPPNAKVVGNYLLGKNIGQGTFGKVHLAMHLPTNQKVAIKLIDKKSMRPKDVLRVKNEIAILSQIRHRNIMHLYEIIQTEKSLLLVTEYLEKGQLFRQIIQQKKLNQEQACRYFQQIIGGVEYLHNNRIAHRDLKPQNILIDYDQQLKIIDFGLSTQYAKNKELKSYCGSPCYAAPQIIEGKNAYNPISADLWSCGVILFAMICGHLPFCDPDTHTLYKKVIAGNYKIPPYVSAAAKDLIQNLLVKVPSKRMTISEIRNHEWFNLVQPSKSYGIMKGDRLRIDYSLIQKMQEMNMTSEKTVYCLSNGQVNKETASYYIFMKKLAKNNQKVPAYIASDCFDPTFIEKCTQKEGIEKDTEEMSPPPTLLESLHGPQMTDQSEQVMAGSSPVWYKQLSQQEEKQMDEIELKHLTQSIIGLVMPDLKKKDQITDLFESGSGVQNKLKNALQNRKEDQFYANNKKNKKSVRNLQLHKKIQIAGVMSDKNRKNNNSSAKNVGQKVIRVRSMTKNTKRSFSVKEPSNPNPQHWNKRQQKIHKDLQILINKADARFTKRMLPYLTLIKDNRLKQKINLIKHNSLHPHLRPVNKHVTK